MNLSAPADTGPLYAETLLWMSRPVTEGGWVEPLNTWSNFAFLAVLLFWGQRVWRAEMKPRSLLLCLPVLAAGLTGGVLYHGLRSWELWYYLDFVPILILTQALAFFLWLRAGWPLTGVLLMLVTQLFFLGLNWFLRLPGPTQGTLFYLPLFVNLLIPASVCWRMRLFPSARPLIAGGALMALALLFRQTDLAAAVYFRPGTHFLWHLFGAASVFFVGELLWTMDIPTRDAKGDAGPGVGGDRPRVG